MDKTINPYRSRGIKIVSEFVAPVDTRTDADKAADEAAARMISEGGPAVPEGTLDAAADAVIAEVTGNPHIEAIEAPAVDTGSLAEIGRE